MSWMQDVRDGNFASRRPLFGCMFGHRWRVHQHNVKTDDQPFPRATQLMVIAWKQCDRCAKSKLIHILK